MGLDIQAWAGYGAVIKFENQTKIQTVPSCDHPEREGNAFCPVCGVRVRNVEREVLTLDPRLVGLWNDDYSDWDIENIPQHLRPTTKQRVINQSDRAIILVDGDIKFGYGVIYVLGWLALGEYNTYGGPKEYIVAPNALDIDHATSLVVERLAEAGLNIEDYRLRMVVSTHVSR